MVRFPLVEIGEYFTKPHPPGKLWLPPAELRSCPASLVPGDERNLGQPRGVCQRNGREASPATYSGRERSTPRRTPAPPCTSALQVWETEPAWRRDAREGRRGLERGRLWPTNQDL